VFYCFVSVPTHAGIKETPHYHFQILANLYDMPIQKVKLHIMRLRQYLFIGNVHQPSKILLQGQAAEGDIDSVVLEYLKPEYFLIKRKVCIIAKKCSALPVPK
jgi:hypothetical protein